MKTIIRLLFRPLVWLGKFLTSGVTILANLLVLGFFAVLLFTVLYTPKVEVPMHSALTLRFDGDLVEHRSPIDPMARIASRLTGSPLKREIFLQDILDTLRAAAQDHRISLLVLDTDALGDAGLDQLRAIGEAIAAFKKQKKTVVAVGDNFNQAQYYLASQADTVYLNPMGGVHLRGFSLFRLHMRELLDNLSIDARVFRVGTFKSTVEPFLRNDMSPEAKEANLLWLNNLWQSYLADITTNRKLDPAVVQELLDHFPARLAEVQGDRAGLALAAGLVDALKTRAEIDELLTQKLGPADNGKGYKQIGFQHYLKTVSRSYTDTADKKQLIGIISATGTILPGDGAIGNIGADDLCKRIRKAGQDARIKALVLRVNTGGGSTLASEQIRQELEQLQKAGKTVVVSMGSMAASGGYWLAANADAIVAAPTTLTGSIGIFGIVPDLQRTLARLGVHGDGVGTTAIARFGNPVAGMSEAEAAMMQLDVERGYRCFIEIVATGRKMSPEQVDRIAQGRIWDGTTAHSLGLVDRLGNLETAVAEAARLAKVPKENAVFLQDDLKEYLGLDQIRQSMQTLLARFVPSLLPRDPVQQLLGEQLDMLPPDAPAGLYSHCLVPLSALSVR